MIAGLSAADEAVFAPWLARWRLTPDGAMIVGPNSRLLPVRRDGEALMLKAGMHPREVRAAGYLRWLGGSGAVAVMDGADDAILMERATGARSLADQDAAGDEAGALNVLCKVAADLHAPRAGLPDELFPLDIWCLRLAEIGGAEGGLLDAAAQRAIALLADPQDVCVLHGDLHQWNVVDGGSRGWLAIDPNGLVGERTFEFALMVMPASPDTEADPAVLRRRAHLVAGLADLDPDRLLAWVSVQAALWAAWTAPGRDWRAIAAAAEAGRVA